MGSLFLGTHSPRGANARLDVASPEGGVANAQVRAARTGCLPPWNGGARAACEVLSNVLARWWGAKRRAQRRLLLAVTSWLEPIKDEAQIGDCAA